MERKAPEGIINLKNLKRMRMIKITKYGVHLIENCHWHLLPTDYNKNLYFLSHLHVVF